MVVRWREGFSLVESLVAMVLLTTVLLGLMGTMFFLTQRGRAVERERALIVASTILDSDDGKSALSNDEIRDGFRIRTERDRTLSGVGVTVRVFTTQGKQEQLVCLHKVARE